MTYICSKPADFFVNKASKFAKLGYEEGQQRRTECAMQPRHQSVGQSPTELAGKRKRSEPSCFAPPPPMPRLAPLVRPRPQQPQALQPLPRLFSAPAAAGYAPGIPMGRSRTASVPNYGAGLVGAMGESSALIEIETESRMLSQEFGKHAADIAGFCQKLTADWAANHGSVNCDAETARNWSSLCAHGKVLQHLVKDMMSVHNKYTELVTFYKYQHMFAGVSESGYAPSAKL